MFDWMPSGVIQDQHHGFNDQRAPNRQLLVLPAGQIPAAALRHLLLPRCATDQRRSSGRIQSPRSIDASDFSSAEIRLLFADGLKPFADHSRQ
jgi:hypothetical protein